jgi:anti-sigma-K factor RskA
MTHDEAWSNLAAVALDALSAEEREAVLAHAAQCATCGPELSSLTETAAEVAYAAPPMPMEPERSARVRARLLARAAADRGGPGVVPLVVPRVASAPSPAARARRWVPWLAAAAIVAVAGIGAALVRALDRNADLEARYVGARASLDSLRVELADRDQLVGALTGERVRVVELTAATPRAPYARMFWDQATDRWTFVAHNLPAPPAGRTYQLWLVTPTSKISAGTFTPRAGQAVVRATYALARDSLQAVAVTEEPAGGVPQPTGPMVIVGAATGG